MWSLWGYWHLCHGVLRRCIGGAWPHRRAWEQDGIVICIVVRQPIERFLDQLELTYYISIAHIRLCLFTRLDRLATRHFANHHAVSFALGWSVATRIHGKVVCCRLRLASPTLAETIFGNLPLTAAAVLCHLPGQVLHSWCVEYHLPSDSDWISTSHSISNDPHRRYLVAPWHPMPSSSAFSRNQAVRLPKWCAAAFDEGHSALCFTCKKPRRPAVRPLPAVLPYAHHWRRPGCGPPSPLLECA